MVKVYRDNVEQKHEREAVYAQEGREGRLYTCEVTTSTIMCWQRSNETSRVLDGIRMQVV